MGIGFLLGLKNVFWSYVLGMVVQPSEHTKIHRNVHFKMVRFMLCELSLSFQKEQLRVRPRRPLATGQQEPLGISKKDGSAMRLTGACKALGTEQCSVLSTHSPPIQDQATVSPVGEIIAFFCLDPNGKAIRPSPNLSCLVPLVVLPQRLDAS